MKIRAWYSVSLKKGEKREFRTIEQAAKFFDENHKDIHKFEDRYPWPDSPEFRENHEESSINPPQIIERPIVERPNVERPIVERPKDHPARSKQDRLIEVLSSGKPTLAEICQASGFDERNAKTAMNILRSRKGLDVVKEGGRYFIRKGR